jgi:hypothetical protein
MKLPGLGRRSSSSSRKVSTTTTKSARGGRAAAPSEARQREVALAKWERALFEETLKHVTLHPTAAAPEMEPPGRVRPYTFTDDGLEFMEDLQEDVELLPPCSLGFKRVQSDEVERRRIVQAMISWRLNTHHRGGPQREA